MADSERTTTSGIVLPDSADKGVPIIALDFDVPGVKFYIAGPDDDDIDALYAAITNRLRRERWTDADDDLELTDAITGGRVILMWQQLCRIVSISRGYAQTVDPTATALGSKLLRASRLPRDLPRAMEN